MSQYLDSTKRLFLYYRSIAEKAIEQLENEQVFITPNENSNTIAVIIQHMSGNMLSRWTDLLTTDGEKPWRNRDMEFTEMIQSKESLMEKWKAGWSCLLNAIDELEEKDLQTIVYIRNEGQTVMDAINRQLAHYSYHVGQIIYVAKLLKTDEWKSLSIPKNRSAEFNSDKFAQEKQVKSFTADIIKSKDV